MEHVFHSERALNATTTTICQGQRSRAEWIRTWKKLPNAGWCANLCVYVCIQIVQETTYEQICPTQQTTHLGTLCPKNRCTYDTAELVITGKPRHTHTHSHVFAVSSVSIACEDGNTCRVCECVTEWHVISPSLSVPNSLHFLSSYLSLHLRTSSPKRIALTAGL